MGKHSMKHVVAVLLFTGVVIAVILIGRTETVDLPGDEGALTPGSDRVRDDLPQLEPLPTSSGESAARAESPGDRSSSRAGADVELGDMARGEASVVDRGEASVVDSGSDEGGVAEPNLLVVTGDGEVAVTGEGSPSSWKRQSVDPDGAGRPPGPTDYLKYFADKYGIRDYPAPADMPDFHSFVTTYIYRAVKKNGLPNYEVEDLLKEAAIAHVHSAYATADGDEETAAGYRQREKELLAKLYEE